jgi:uncharacterized membrane protein (DUF2068 family)
MALVWTAEMTRSPAMSPTTSPGTEKARQARRKGRYELLSCGLHGHVLIGLDAARILPEDGVIVRELDGVRWHRCLRCDAWLPRPIPLPAETGRELIPTRQEIHVPLRGRPLRDRFVLRLIALDRVVHVLVLSSITVAIFLFAADRDQLHKTYVRILDDLQGGLGGPIFDTKHGVFHEVNRLFALSKTELYLIGGAVALYTVILALEAFGLWFARRWAEYLTLIETGVLVPFEIYELTTRVSPLKILTLVINLAIVLYLLISKRLFGLRGGGKAEEAIKKADTGWPAVDRATPLFAPAANQAVVT